MSSGGARQLELLKRFRRRTTRQMCRGSQESGKELPVSPFKFLVLHWPQLLLAWHRVRAELSMPRPKKASGSLVSQTLSCLLGKICDDSLKTLASEGERKEGMEEERKGEGKRENRIRLLVSATQTKKKGPYHVPRSKHLPSLASFS